MNNELLWQRLELLCTAVDKKHPRGGLLPGVPPQEIDRIQNAMGLKFPEDLRDAYRHFNGMSSGPDRLDIFPRRIRWIELTSESGKDLSLIHWEALRKIEQFELSDAARLELRMDDEEIMRLNGHATYCCFADSTRIPVGDMGCGPGLYVDTAPPPNGKIGQLVYADPESTEFPEVWAGNFTEAIEKVVVAYEEGRIRYDFDARRRWVHSVSGKDVKTIKEL